MMRRSMKLIVLMLILAMTLIACGTSVPDQAEEPRGAYQTLTAAEAKAMLDGDEDIILLDVRTPEEFAEGYIPGAIQIADTELKDQAPLQLPDKDAKILVYCRSGRRSQASAALLAEMGYTQIYDMGGIIDWPYEIVK